MGSSVSQVGRGSMGDHRVHRGDRRHGARLAGEQTFLGVVVGSRLSRVGGRGLRGGWLSAVLTWLMGTGCGV